MDRKAVLDRAHEVIGLNIEALKALDATLGDSLAEACRIILERPGYLIVTGMGKSGHIGGKLAATLASTGTDAFFVHPAEMSHGDLGMLRGDATLLALSNSGESRELRDPLLYCKRMGIPVIGMTQKPESFLARMSTVTLLMPKVAEACPNGLAPTTSTLMSLALGDALAMVLMDLKGFGREDFGRRHPGGALGMSLQTVREWLQARGPIAPATIAPDASFSEVVSAITAGRQGCVVVTDAEGHIAGMITDGDVRRAFDRDVSTVTARDIMSDHPATVDLDDRMSDVIDILTSKSIPNVLVAENDKPVAVAHVAELMQSGYLG